MPSFPPRQDRQDPFRQHLFRILIAGKPVAGLSKMTGGLKRTTQVIKWREAGDITPRHLIGPTDFEPVTLEQGLAYDTTFEDWANLVNDFSSHSSTVLPEFRKDVTINLLNEAGQPVRSYILHGAWVSKYNALPDLAADANAVAINSIEIQYDWFERDRDVNEQPDQGPARQP